MVYIDGNIEVGGTLTVHYDNGTEFQRYRNGELIPGEENTTYVLLITDQGQEITCVVRDGVKFETAEPIYIDYYNLEVKPIEKQYIIKLYDGGMNFIRVLPSSLITNDIGFTESIDAGQGELTLNINLPIDTDYFNNIRYCKVYVSDNRSLDNYLLYSGWLSKVNRAFSNNKENIQITFLSLYTLLNDIYFMDDGYYKCYLEDTPDNLIKKIIDYFSTYYPGIITYTNESIDTYPDTIYMEFDTQTCGECIKKIMEGVNWYFFIGADGVVQFHEISNTIKHNFTYEKDITTLNIPEDYEQVANAVMSKYTYVGGSHTGITDIVVDNDSIARFGRKEVIVDSQAYGDTAGEQFRDSYIAEYKNGKRNITLTVNTLYPIESIHPGDTIKIRNLNLDISALKISRVDYTYEQARISLEYYTSMAEQIFNS